MHEYIKLTIAKLELSIGRLDSLKNYEHTRVLWVRNSITELPPSAQILNESNIQKQLSNLEFIRLPK